MARIYTSDDTGRPTKLFEEYYSADGTYAGKVNLRTGETYDADDRYIGRIDEDILSVLQNEHSPVKRIIPSWLYY